MPPRGSRDALSFLAKNGIGEWFVLSILGWNLKEDEFLTFVTFLSNRNEEDVIHGRGGGDDSTLKDNETTLMRMV